MAGEIRKKIIEPFVCFRVFGGQKRFIYPRNTLKDAKISKTKIAWFAFRRHDRVEDNAFHRFTPKGAWPQRGFTPFNASRLQPITRGEASLRGGEADDLLFGPDGKRTLGRGQESFLDVFLGAGNEIAAATQVEFALNIFAMALNVLTLILSE